MPGTRPPITRNLLLLVALLASRQAVAAQAPLPLDALMDAMGTISISDGSREVSVVEPGTALEGWKGISTGKPEPLGKGRAGRRYLLDDGGEVTIEASAVRRGKDVAVTYRFATTATLSMESVHASLNSPVGPWVGAAYRVGKAAGTIPPAAAENVRLAQEVATKVALGPSAALGGLAYTIMTPAPAPLLVQDSRKWWPNLELRVIDAHEGKAPWLWKPGSPVTIRFTLGANRGIRYALDAPVTVRAGKDWVPLREGLEIEPGSALDFSGQGLTRTPAGALGRVRASATRPGAFEFEGEPGRPLRFYGNNIGLGACSPTHEEAERLADRFARRGYTVMRIHHYEMPPWDIRNGLLDSEAPDSLTFNAERMEKFDYLVAALRKRGIYLATDLYVSRAVRSSEVFPGTDGRLTDNGYHMKHLVCVSATAMENWKAFSRLLLTHVNPHTGLALKDDPALGWLVLVNEGNLANGIDDLVRDPRWAPLWKSAWAAWKLARGVTAEWGSPEFHRFLWDIHRRTEAEQIRFLRQELGVRVMISDLNGWTDEWGAQACRTAFDWVDNHSYWDHPSWVDKEWQLPSRGSNGGGSAVAAGWLAGSTPLTRLFDRPFSISEYNFCPPNSYRGESGLLFGAGAALQDWGIVWRFSYSGSAKGSFDPGPVSYFDSVDDPLTQAAEYAAVALFARGDADPLVPSVVVAVPEAGFEAMAGERIPGDLASLAWCARIGSRIGDTADGPGQVVITVRPGMDARAEVDGAVRKLRATGALGAGNATDTGLGTWESANGQVKLECGIPVLTVATPRTEGVVGPAGTSRTPGALAVEIRDTWTTLWASSLDGRPLADSGRILVAHLTDVKNSGDRFRGRDMKVLEAWGKKPYLVRAGRATVRLAHANPSTLQVWRLDASGRRAAKVKAKVAGKSLVFEASTAPAGTFFYEITGAGKVAR